MSRTSTSSDTLYAKRACIYHLLSYYTQSYLNLSQLKRERKHRNPLPPLSTPVASNQLLAPSLPRSPSVRGGRSNSVPACRAHHHPSLLNYLIDSASSPRVQSGPSSFPPSCGEVCKLEPDPKVVPSVVGCRCHRRRRRRAERGEVEVPEVVQRRPELARGGRPLLMTDCTVDAGETDRLR